MFLIPNQNFVKHVRLVILVSNPVPIAPLNDLISMKNLLNSSLLILAVATGAGCQQHQPESHIVPQGAREVFTPSEALVGTWKGTFYSKKTEKDDPVISHFGTLVILSTGTIIFQSDEMGTPCGGTLSLEAPDRGYLTIDALEEIGASLFISKRDRETLILKNEIPNQPCRYTLLYRRN